MLAEHPELLVGNEIDPESPPNWLPINREPTIPDDEASSGRWWLDHCWWISMVFPTLVEVKRSTDGSVDVNAASR